MCVCAKERQEDLRRQKEKGGRDASLLYLTLNVTYLRAISLSSASKGTRRIKRTYGSDMECFPSAFRSPSACHGIILSVLVGTRSSDQGGGEGGGWFKIYFAKC